MAIFKGHVLYHEIAGSIGNTTWWRARGGIRSKARVAPTNPRTTVQQVNRGRFATFSQHWRQLSEQQRQTYNVYAKSLRTRQRLGYCSRLNGFNLHQRQCQYFREVNGSLPTIISPSVIKDYARISSVVQSANDCFITTICSDTSANTYIFYYCTNYRAANYKAINPSLKRLIYYQQSNGGAITLNLSFLIGLTRGSLLLNYGKRLEVGIRTVNIASGEASVIQWLSFIVTP